MKLMEYKFLGNTGMKVSEIMLGTQTFGWVTEEKLAISMMDRFVENGGNFFDTADIYNEGVSELILGSWLKASKNRDTLVLESKVFFPTGDGPNDTGASKKHILQSIDKSLKRLHTDYIDLYQIHCLDRSTPLEETLETLNLLVRSGKVRYIGASNYTPSALQKALMLSRMGGISSYCELQAEYSLLVRSTEWELLPLCLDEGLGFLAWSPLAGGWLTGKYRKNQKPPQNSRVGRKDRWDDQPEQRESEITWRVVDLLDEIGKNRGKSPAQIALNWVKGQHGVTAPIIGARTKEQLDQNLGSVGWELSHEEREKLNRASNIPLPYPYRFVEQYTRKR
jgi:aryl-alcohol dehydrogenase-like predicted oxidoreductase